MYGNSAKFCARVSECVEGGAMATKARASALFQGQGEREEEESGAQTARLGGRPGRTEPISLSIPLHHACRDGHLCKLDRTIASYIAPGHRFSGTSVGIQARRVTQRRLRERE